MFKIALFGKAKSGKNSVANIIVNDYLDLDKNDYKIAAFADKIKETIQFLFPNCDEKSLYGASELRQNRIVSDLNSEIDIKTTYRQVSLDLGKMGRLYSPIFWVAHLATDFKNINPKTKAYVVADGRFISEFDWLKKNNFKIVKIKREQDFKINDISETEQETIPEKSFDYILDNNSSMEELKTNVSKMMTSIFPG